MDDALQYGRVDSRESDSISTTVVRMGVFLYSSHGACMNLSCKSEERRRGWVS